MSLLRRKAPKRRDDNERQFRAWTSALQDYGIALVASLRRFQTAVSDQTLSDVDRGLRILTEAQRWQRARHKGRPPHPTGLGAAGAYASDVRLHHACRLR